MRERGVVVLFVPVLLAAAALVGGVHYVGAPGGNPARTHGNHVAGLILLTTAATVLLLGVAALRVRQIWRLALAVLVAVLVTGGGFGLAQHALVAGERCACEGL
jgi:hypothetical protein